MEAKTDVLLGLQWGDEGKGKIVDFLTPHYDVVARFQGGPNAGHTIEFENRKFVLHTIPSGVFIPETINVIGSGVLIDPYIFDQEVQSLKSSGVDLLQQVLISRKAHLILPAHRLLDAVYEKAKGKEKIGSTLKGIGPAYTDKTARKGLRVGDLELPGFPNRYQNLREQHLQIASLYDSNPEEVVIEGLPFKEYEEEWLKKLETLNRFKKTDSEYFLNQALKSGKSVLAEGAQGTLLDVDFGAYPFVTSSNTTVAGVCSGLGIPPSEIGKVYGIFKAYCTRVGSGPFPTELFDETGQRLREKGHEFGATTGRPRRCGWLDLPALKYAIMLNGVTELKMMKADVLSGFSEIKVAVAYRVNGKETNKLPFDMDRTVIEPVYQSFEGWNDELEKAKTFNDLPPALKNYIRFIETETGVPVSLVSTGPDRSQTIVK
ncbi:adenylosuccinate synthase [Candidatus Sulfidibacterium hydrothermale]|uniref:adenylosuccinate synthase n=1 Tax=Candidatus Sulfidibacterium hydrothermale TaxID=2875962 RepID=UPI001F0A6AD6|nr:adenylosuccinate synthase [Candidatus Sulfidibacterium hydrothermale]UBM61831.1 adenylosuccinate synthase [Candidatus Sulfidibacterium hydrothermale]